MRNQLINNGEGIPGPFVRFYCADVPSKSLRHEPTGKSEVLTPFAVSAVKVAGPESRMLGRMAVVRVGQTHRMIFSAKGALHAGEGSISCREF